MPFVDISSRKFIEALASKEAVPGGGGASALVGAVGIALGSMVGALTIGKKKYAGVEDDIKALMNKAEKIQQDLLILVEKDAEAFAPLAKAYGMPKNTEEEKEKKKEIMEDALNVACSVPLEIMKKCCQAIELQQEFAAKGSVLALSDAGVGTAFCKGALQGASLNVFINTRAMQDRNYAEKINKEAFAMLDKYCKLADEIYDGVLKRLI